MLTSDNDMKRTSMDHASTQQPRHSAAVDSEKNCKLWLGVREREVTCAQGPNLTRQAKPKLQLRHGLNLAVEG